MLEPTCDGKVIDPTNSLATSTTRCPRNYATTDHSQEATNEPPRHVCYHGAHSIDRRLSNKGEGHMGTILRWSRRLTLQSGILSRSLCSLGMTGTTHASVAESSHQRPTGGCHGCNPPAISIAKSTTQQENNQKGATNHQRPSGEQSSRKALTKTTLV